MLLKSVPDLDVHCLQNSLHSTCDSGHHSRGGNHARRLVSERQARFVKLTTGLEQIRQVCAGVVEILVTIPDFEKLLELAIEPCGMCHTSLAGHGSILRESGPRVALNLTALHRRERLLHSDR